MDSLARGRLTRTIRAIGRRFRKDPKGAAALEFALISLPFFALLFAIIEVSLMFFMGQLLDSATTSAARLIRTGEAITAAMTADQFKAKVCSGMVGLADCTNHLYVDVQWYGSTTSTTAFGSYSHSSPVDDQGNITATHFQLQDGVIVVRSFYAWPVYFNFLSGTLPKLANGRMLIGAVTAFQTEPYH